MPLYESTILMWWGSGRYLSVRSNMGSPIKVGYRRENVGLRKISSTTAPPSGTPHFKSFVLVELKWSVSASSKAHASRKSTIKGSAYPIRLPGCQEFVINTSAHKSVYCCWSLWNTVSRVNKRNATSISDGQTKQSRKCWKPLIRSCSPSYSGT